MAVNILNAYTHSGQCILTFFLSDITVEAFRQANMQVDINTDSC